jgi:hypothetical protein
MHRVRPAAAKAAVDRLAVAETWKPRVRAAIAAYLTGSTARNAGPDIHAANTIARLATHANGAAAAINTRSAIRRAASCIAQTTAAAARSNVSARAADAATAAVVQALAARSVRSADADLQAIRITTSTRVRQSLKRPIRTTRCVARATSCSTIRHRSDRIERGERSEVSVLSAVP